MTNVWLRWGNELVWAVIIVAAALSAVMAWRIQDWRHAQARVDQLEQQHKEQERLARKALGASTDYETKRSNTEIRYVTVTETIEKIVDRPVYRQQCMDDDGLRALNEQIRGSADSRQSGPAVPSVATPDRN